MTRGRRGTIVAALIALPAVIGLGGCDRLDMYDEPRYEPLEASRLFRDGMSARPQVPGTIARGLLHEDTVFYTGLDAGRPIAAIPESVGRQLFERQHGESSTATPSEAELRRLTLERGRERFNIYCAACHGRTGDGGGMIVQRGFRRPPDYDVERLRNAPSGHFFDVITHGFGAMPAFANRIDPIDRWAITAYIRALQLSRRAAPDDVPPDARAELEGSP